MTSAPFRRIAATATATALVGSLAAILPAQVAASAPTTSVVSERSHVHSVAGRDGVVVRRHTRIQLVRNGGFHRGGAHWSAAGTAEPQIRIVRPGLHSPQAAKVVATRRGRAVLRERLDSRRTHAGDRYRATAMVRPAGSHDTFTLRLIERKAGRVVGQRIRQVVVRHHEWRRLQVRYSAHRTGSILILRIESGVQPRNGGFVADNVDTVQTLQVVVHPQLPPTSSLGSGSCKLSAILVPSCGVLWGAYKHPASGLPWSSAVTDLENQVGRPFNIVYRYHDFSGTGGNGAFPDSDEQSLYNSGHILMDDWQTVIYSTHQNITWADVANGNYDSTVIDPEAKRIKAFGKPLMLAFDHEMDAMTATSGTAAEFVAAYRHIYNEFARLGVTNVIWVWTVTGYGARDNVISTFYPGDSYVDWIGYDPYNFASCHKTGWKTFNQTIDPFYQWLESNGFGDKPFILPEYGTVPDPNDSTAAAKWFAGIPAALATHPNIKGLLEWDSSSGGCDTTLTASPGELAAFAAAGNDPALATS